MTIAETAARLASQFGTRTTDSGHPRLIITGQYDSVDSAPYESADHDTLRAMVFAADQSGLGDDFQYEAVRDALAYLADQDYTTTQHAEDDAHEFADSFTDVYNNALIAWLAAAPLSHMQLCDEAAEELGSDSQGSLIKIIMLGQYEGYRRAYAAVLSSWPEDTDEDTCSECGASLDDGEGYDGLCSNCADKAEPQS